MVQIYNELHQGCICNTKVCRDGVARFGAVVTSTHGCQLSVCSTEIRTPDAWDTLKAVTIKDNLPSVANMSLLSLNGIYLQVLP